MKKTQDVVVKSCPACELFTGKCYDTQFNCSDIALCTTKQIVIECFNAKESNNTGNEAWLLANTILSILEVEK